MDPVATAIGAVSLGRAGSAPWPITGLVPLLVICALSERPGRVGPLFFVPAEWQEMAEKDEDLCGFHARQK